ncbi:MAG: hypothetical protein PUB32_10205 [Clostridiales bacterium]|nr:hypothetical protein [Clostridiales bacterium]
MPVFTVCLYSFSGYRRQQFCAIRPHHVGGNTDTGTYTDTYAYTNAYTNTYTDTYAYTRAFAVT